jgi:protein-L-isoaspartate O-methyltransferase
MSLVNDVIQYYAARAPVFDETAGYSNPADEYLRKPIKARYQKLFAGHNVLEIACATGYWTSAIAETARAVLAVDINVSLLIQAKNRCKQLSNVIFQLADAYTLDGIPSGFNAAFGILWWSHIPREQIISFLKVLHSKLIHGAIVMFVDQLPYGEHIRRQDGKGNTIEQRALPDGRSFEIVKNFYSEEDIRNVLAGMAENMKYVQHPDEKSWDVIYNVKHL